jgi:glycosyltransferase involved in cell wall biosynthesis
MEEETLTIDARRRKVAVDFHCVDGIHQGIRTHCLELFGRVVRQAEDIDFHLLLAEPDKLLAAHPEFERLNVKLVRMSKRSAAVRLLHQLPQLAREHGFDLLHCQYIVPPFSPCATAVTIHDTLFESHPQYYSRFFVARSRLFMRRSARNSALVCTVSDFSRNELARRYGLQLNNIVTVANGVNFSRFGMAAAHDPILDKYGLAQGRYILSVGRLEPRKNQARLVEAYSTLPHPRPKLVLIGQRDFGYGDLLRVVQERRLQEEVSILESVEDDELPVLYRNALLFAYPSLAEGFGMPLLEAMASGVPIVTSGNTALGEVSGDAAVLVDPESISSIAEGMRELLMCEPRRHELVARGLQRARDYQWDKSSGTLVEAYETYFNLRSMSDELASARA